MPGLIKKKQPLMQPAIPVKKTQEADFAYTETKVAEKVAVAKEVVQTEPAKSKGIIGKKNSTKSIKVPTVVHTEINLLGSFMDQNKTYEILQTLIDSYVQNELTDRQRRQFEFMVEAFNRDEH